MLPWIRQVPHPPLRLLAAEFPGVLLFYFAFIWLAPVPWQWDPPDLARPWRVLRALAATEALMMAIVVVDDLLGRWAGRGATPSGVYLTNACFQGPALFLVGHLLATRETLEAERAALRQKSEEALVQHLKGQIHPHVLFNALNGLAELVEEDPVEAEACIRAMSDFLRRTLAASERPTWALSEERRLAEEFLRMESMRLGDRLRVRWAWDPATLALPVLPLLVQPLVENALKHGLRPLEAGGELEVGSRLEGRELLLEVRNTGRAPGRRGAGVGLENLRARLALAYGDGAAFDLLREEPWTTARIRLNLSRLEDAHAQLADPGGG